MNPIDRNYKEELIQALCIKLNQAIIDATYETVPLHGGTLGTVMLVSGTAKTSEGKEVPYSMVHKTQKQWSRHFDTDSWRREFDLYASGLDELFSESFRWPKCYHSKLSDNELQLWMEYIEGSSASALTLDMFEQIAKELGRFQGQIFAKQPVQLQHLSNLSNPEFAKKNYYHYRSWPEVYDYIRDENCSLPKHLCRMLIELDENADDIWKQIESLPIVFCHRDFWITNIFYSNGKIRLIDWDTTGWGYLGEDIASLITNESAITNPYILEMMLLKFGYRLVEAYKFGDTEEERQLQLDTLQKIYEIQTLLCNRY